MYAAVDALAKVVTENPNNYKTYQLFTLITQAMAITRNRLFLLLKFIRDKFVIIAF